MTVNPGWGGQSFLRGLARPDRAPARPVGAGRRCSRSTAGSTRRPPALCARAGATLFVAGSAVFGAADPAAAVREIAEAASAEAGSH